MEGNVTRREIIKMGTASTAAVRAYKYSTLRLLTVSSVVKASLPPHSMLDLRR